MPQSTSGHGHNSAAPYVASHAHTLAVQSQGPAVVQGHVHPPAPMSSTQGQQQQFQRLKVWMNFKSAIRLCMLTHNKEAKLCTSHRTLQDTLYCIVSTEKNSGLFN